MFPLVSESCPPTTRGAIESYERKFGTNLPDLYKEFLVKSNGGRPDSPRFPIKGMALNPFGGVQFFLGICPENDDFDLVATFDMLKERIPVGVLPIAFNGGGDYICLDLRAGRERVVFWDFRHFWGTSEWREADLYHVANSFEEFLGSLQPDPPLE